MLGLINHIGALEKIIKLLSVSKAVDDVPWRNAKKDFSVSQKLADLFGVWHNRKGFRLWKGFNL